MFNSVSYILCFRRATNQYTMLIHSPVSADKQIGSWIGPVFYISMPSMRILRAYLEEMHSNTCFDSGADDTKDDEEKETKGKQDEGAGDDGTGDESKGDGGKEEEEEEEEEDEEDLDIDDGVIETDN